MKYAGELVWGGWGQDISGGGRREEEAREWEVEMVEFGKA